jgi:hypothetical protein
MSAGQLARHRSPSSASRPSNRAATPIDARLNDVDFEPCAATASIFLYSQNTSIICLHHDTLALERRFDKHSDRVLGISVDNISERGAGRLVVSFDAGRTAIVWDLFTGEEVTRFQYYEDIKVAAWMKNGQIACGRSRVPRGSWHSLTRMLQETRRAMLSYSTPPTPNMRVRGRYSIQLQPLRQQGTARHMQLGEYVQAVYQHIADDLSDI